MNCASAFPAISEDLRLAQAFLETIEDPRASWIEAFTTWAQERGLTEAEAQRVKVAIVRLRNFGPVGRHRGGKGRKVR